MKLSSHRFYFAAVVLSLIAIPPRGALKEKPGHLSAEIFKSSQTDTVHTPTEGSAEHQAIMAGLRFTFGGAKSVFVVHYLKVHNGWAWVKVTQMDDDEEGATWESLLHKAKGKWEVKSLPSEAVEASDAAEGSEPAEGSDEIVFGEDHSQYNKKIREIKRAYPTVPTDIFPQP